MTISGLMNLSYNRNGIPKMQAKSLEKVCGSAAGPNYWFRGAVVGAEENTELGIQLRTSPGGGFGKFFWILSFYFNFDSKPKSNATQTDYRFDTSFKYEL